MARTAQLTARGFSGRVRVWGDVLGGVKRRLFEGLGMLLVLASLLLLLALLTYNPGDASLNTAVAAPARNYLGHDGAVIADLLIQSIGLAVYLLPAVLLGWAFRLMLQRPIRRLGRKLGLLLLALLLGAVACSVLHPALALALPAGAGGAVGWAVLRLIERVGLATLALPVAMIVAAVVALLLLSVIGLSPGDWRDIGGGAGRGASRIARASGRGTVAAAQFGQYLFRRWRGTRRAFDEPPAASSYQAVIKRGAGAAPRLAVVPDRREPRLGPVPAGAPPQLEAEPERIAGRLARLVMPRTKPQGPGKRAAQELQPALALDDEPVLPPLGLLAKPPTPRTETVDEEALAKNARMLEAVLEDFGVRGGIVQVRPGPVVTLYELEPAAGIKASRVIGLADDIARSMSAVSVRVAVVPGRTVIGIELPNVKAETVFLRELLDSPVYEKHAGRLALALGKDIGGEPVIADLARMPHLLIAGTTGSGKSVGINTMILSILYRMPPERCKFIMVDPKMLELSVYDGIPHLLAPVVTDPRKAVLALKWTVREMESRYQKMSKLGVRNIEGFNTRLREAAAKGESLIRKVQTGFDPESGEPVFEEQPFDASELPLIIVVVDEMADLMLVAGKDIEAAIQRLSQMARAAGIHII
ncbi:MAG TPA: DNA translocase FtsK 4TM domain-containing protein, partial [Stellaceae bacterium]|nr:DNA translocase FtsK 4TM domain-containing protein [Stellaceae bacterium]